MKKKIHLQLVAISAIAIFITFVLVMAVSYDFVKEQVFEDLNAYVHLVKNTMEQSPDKDLNKIEAIANKQIRITWILPDGVVAYDSMADEKQMENHMERPEIAAALQLGESKMVRHSQTMDKNTIYYAVCMEDGSVLRAGKNIDNILGVFKSMIPSLLGVIAIALIVAVITANILTKSLISPIENIAAHMDNLEHVEVYRELVPFVNTIKNQHEDILKSAMVRQEFTANVSHELKTPLTAISGYAELIENGMAGEEDSRRFAAEIHRNAQRLLTQINDIIRLSQLDVSDDDEPFEEVNLYKVCQKSVEMLKVNAAKHDVSIFFEGVPCLVMGNKDMIEEIVYNLCDNAIRYNNKDGIVEVFVRPVEDKVVLIVRDTGIGIGKEHQERIFERYYRVDKSRSKSTGGTGLGLAIVKHIVAKHNASMELMSEKGKGTTIEITFPKKEW